ncbi:MAG: TIGR03067 domain-containing protein, partial [Planctomycetes bacterium]|nr:TIGR03067 domain-containing protein [Planctomycetota bacterium]
LYKLLCGRPPFLGATAMETVRQVTDTEAVSPRILIPALPRDLDTICLKCLRKKASDRYASAADLADDLQRFLDGKPTIARPVGRLAKIQRWCQRNPAVAGLAAALLIAVAAGVAFGAWQVNNYLTEKNNVATKALQLADEQTKLAEEQGLKLEAEQKAAAEERLKAQALQEKAELELKSKKAAERHGAELEDRLYINRIHLASREWFANRPQETKRLLEESTPANDVDKLDERDLRNWEWNYIKRLTKAGRVDLDSHLAFVNCVTYSRDGRRIASGDSDGKVKVWLWLDDRFAFPIDLSVKHSGQVKGVAFSADGRWLASSSQAESPATKLMGVPPNLGGGVKIWNMQDLKSEPLSLPGSGSGAVAWNPKRNELASDGGGRVTISDVTGKFVKFLGEKVGMVRGLAFSPDGTRLAAVTDCFDNRFASEVKVWDVESGKEIAAFIAHALWSHSIAFSPDGKRLVTGGGDKAVSIWNAETGQRLQNLWGHAKYVHAVAYSPDGRDIASAGVDGQIKIWEADTGNERMTLRRDDDSPIWTIAYRPDGKRLISSGMSFSITMWNPELAVERRDRPGDVYFTAISPDGRRIASGGQFASGGATVWGLRKDPTFDAVLVKERFIFKGHSRILALAFSNDGRAASASDKLDFSAKRKPDKKIEGLQFQRTGEIKIWDAATGKEEKTFVGHNEQILAIAFSPDGKLLASASEDKLVKIWNIAEGKEILTFERHKGKVNSLAFRKDGILATAAGEVIIWDPLTGKERLTYKGHATGVAHLCFSADGKQIASAAVKSPYGRETSEVHVWDPENGKLLFSLTGHAKPVTCVAFNPDGRRLATASEDGTVKIWDMGTHQEVLSLGGTDAERYTFVSFTPDGLLVAAGPRGIMPGRISIWDGRPPDAKPIESKPTAAEIAMSEAEAATLQGDWKMVSLEDDGRKLMPMQLEGRHIVIEGNSLRFMTGEKTHGRYTFKINSTWLPKEIDLQTGKDASLGIYHLDGNTLKLCLNQKPSAERPEYFNAANGSARVLLEFKRGK